LILALIPDSWYCSPTSMQSDYARVLTLKRLIIGLQNIKSLSDFEDLIEEKSKTLETFNTKITAAEGTLNVLEKNIINKIVETANQGLTNITSLSHSATTEMSRVKDSAIAQISNVEMSYNEQLNRIAEARAQKEYFLKY